jgi:hypothetical protein
MPRRARFTQALTTGPDWLERLRTAVFAVLPALDEAYQVRDSPFPVLCQRLLLDQGPTVLFVEKWLDPRTYAIQRTWSLPCEAGPFVGPVPEPVFAQQVACLLAGIAAAREGMQRPPPPPPFIPHRYAYRPLERGGWL